MRQKEESKQGRFDEEAKRREREKEVGAVNGVQMLLYECDYISVW